MYLSGQIGLDPATGSMVSGGVASEAEQVKKDKYSQFIDILLFITNVI